MPKLKLSSSGFVRVMFAAAMLLPGLGFAQAKPAPKPEQVQLLFVQNARGIVVDKEQRTLTLKGVGHTTLFFSDRPVRIAGHWNTKSEFLGIWGQGEDSFVKDPPNATLSVFEPGQKNLTDVVIKIQNPRMKGDDLTYDITIIEGKLPKAGGPASLFIDLFGRWLVAGVAVSATRSADAAAAAAASRPTTVYVTAPPAPAPPPPAAPAVTSAQATTVQKMKELKSLLNQGLITQAQYQADSQKLLNELVQ